MCYKMKEKQKSLLLLFNRTTPVVSVPKPAGTTQKIVGYTLVPVLIPPNCVVPFSAVVMVPVSHPWKKYLCLIPCDLAQ